MYGIANILADLRFFKIYAFQSQDSSISDLFPGFYDSDSEQWWAGCGQRPEAGPQGGRMGAGVRRILELTTVSLLEQHKFTSVPVLIPQCPQVASWLRKCEKSLEFLFQDDIPELGVCEALQGLPQVRRHTQTRSLWGPAGTTPGKTTSPSPRSSKKTWKV